MTLLFGLTFNISMNLFIYFIGSIIILFLNLLWVHSQDKDPGLAHVFALISWITAFVSLSFTKSPENEITYWLFIICSILAFALMFVEPFFRFIVTIPESIRSRRTNKKVKVKETKVKMTFIQEL